MTDEFPTECPHICGSYCMDIAATKMERGEWKIPVLIKSHGGYCHNISKPRKGYDAQPGQESLLNALIDAANEKVSRPAAADSEIKQPRPAGRLD